VIVFESAHIVLDIDFRPLIEEHKARGEAMTVVYKKINDADQEFRKAMSMTSIKTAMSTASIRTMALRRTPTSLWRSGSSTGPSSPI
jgi:ADP-glucose pyrophosphorylase